MMKNKRFNKSSELPAERKIIQYQMDCLMFKMTNRNVSIGARNKNSVTYFAIMRNWVFFLQAIVVLYILFSE